MPERPGSPEEPTWHRTRPMFSTSAYSYCPICGKHRSHRLHSDRCAKTLQRQTVNLPRPTPMGPKWNEVPLTRERDKRGRMLK